MRISIVTPSYQSLKWLPRCIGSVVQQSGVEYEHIVVDGGSRDGTREWLQEYSSRSAVTRRRACGGFSWVSEPDKGMYDAINKGWRKSTGDILAWLNADEQYLPGLFEFVVGYFNKHPELDILYGNTIIVDEYGKALAARREVPLRHWYIRNTFLNIFSCTIFFRRRLFDRGLLEFDPNYRYAGDMDLVLRLLAAGVRHGSTHSYHSLFMASSTNLSHHEEMRMETLCVQKKHGAYGSAPVRRGVQFVRQMERFVRWCYFPGSIRYDYVVDERGMSQARHALCVSGRFNLARMS
jgi:glycosyltransferase involved in cell wall biosynthesis